MHRPNATHGQLLRSRPRLSWHLAVAAVVVDNAIAAEDVWNDIQSPPPFYSQNAGGGGPSELWDRPSWQRGPGTVEEPRTTPDVALFADPFPGYLVNLCPVHAGPCTTDNWNKVGGTSAATPLLAGALALLIQQARGRSQTRMGFPAPLLYCVRRDLCRLFDFGARRERVAAESVHRSA